jgi:hypothetical protein
MSHKRQVWETFSQLAQRLLAAADADAPAPPAGSGEVTQELKRLGKAQFKAGNKRPSNNPRPRPATTY